MAKHKEIGAVFVTRLNAELAKRGWTQKQFAELLEISEPAITRWLSGQHEPKAYSIARMAQVLEVSADYLLGLTDYRYFRFRQIINSD